MNKECSFLIIIIIGYLSYSYCSKTIEGITSGVNYGTYDLSQDLAQTPGGNANQQSGGTIDVCSSQDTQNPMNTCYYKDKNCNNLRSSWVNGYEYDSNNNENRQKCMRCIQSNTSTGTTTNYLARVGLENQPTQGQSEFAKYYCDALIADCSDRYWYALDQTDFNNECTNISIGGNASNMSKFICSVMTNTITGAFFGFLFSIISGVSCTLEIKASEAKRYISGKIDCMECKIDPTESDCDNVC